MLNNIFFIFSNFIFHSSILTMKKHIIITICHKVHTQIKIKQIFSLVYHLLLHSLLLLYMVHTSTSEICGRLLEDRWVKYFIWNVWNTNIEQYLASAYILHFYSSYWSQIILSELEVISPPSGGEVYYHQH